MTPRRNRHHTRSGSDPNTRVPEAGIPDICRNVAFENTRNRSLLLALSATLLMTPTACGDDGSTDPPIEPDAMVEIDNDEDGFAESVDCRDDDRFVNPGAIELCDGIDNDCDTMTDEGYNEDGDLYTVCTGDCRDHDATSYPGAPELPDGVDNNCDGIIDNDTIFSDDDGDGYSEDQGDCNDDPNGIGAFINPGAVEVQLDADGNPEGLDNDCDGNVDEALIACDSGGPRDDPWSYAHAFEACNFTSISQWDPQLGIDPRSRNILADFGTYMPRAGDDFFVLSTGVASDADQADFVYPQSGTLFSNYVAHPSPLGPVGCSSADPGFINDYSEVEFRLEVPSNASAFSFDFNFMSVEFPEWVCSAYDDTFMAILDSEAFSGNVSFDAQGNRVSINVGFFDVCDINMAPGCGGSAPLAGSGYDVDGGGTGWLTTTAPVVPGEKISLKFVIFDEGDRQLDSLAIVDNFRWEVDDVTCPDGSEPPCTIGIHAAPKSRFRYTEKAR